MSSAETVLDPLETVASRGFNRYDVFRDWVRLMLAALQRDDDRYLDVLDGYDRGRDREKGDRNADLFAEAFGRLQAAMGETNRDVLGETYEAFGMQNDDFGQHFTPHPVASMMAEATVGDAETADPPVTIADPACGSGRMLVLAARQTDAETFCFGQDKDLLCAQMAALNGCFFNLNSLVIYGDSITMEKRRAWQTRHTVVGGEVSEVDDPDALALPEATFEESEDEEPSERVSVSASGGPGQAAIADFMGDTE